MNTKIINAFIVILVGVSLANAQSNPTSANTNVKSGSNNSSTLDVAIPAQPTVIITAPAAAKDVQSNEAVADTSPAEKARTAKKEFNKLVDQRNQLHQRLSDLDAKALSAVKNDERPVAVHAEQISVQDKLDLIALRLEMLAMRYDMAIPPVNNGDKEDSQNTDPEAAAELKIDEFSRGTERTLGKLRSQTLKLLASLELEEFLESRREITQ